MNPATSPMPEINASLNALSAVLIVIGFFFIKSGRYRAHGWTMVLATLVSTIFLACYLTYHIRHGEKTTHAHPGILRDAYLIVLLPHLFFAVVLLPMIFVTLRRAWRRDWASHRRMSVPTFWVWIYVSLSGVAVYFMLYHTSLAT
ncbi:MAG: DUF420 domain-containing protein [Tepidisphaeraceae bacterium]|jgi:uncharacterized membrane protein YozB (DUF420 family)